MKKWAKTTGFLCAAVMAVSMGMTSFGNSTVKAAATGLEQVQFDGTVISAEDGRLMIGNVRNEENESREDMIVTISETTRILDAVNGYPIPLSDLTEGEAVRVYVSPAMTMSLPPQTRGVLVLAGIPADAAFPVCTTVDKCEQNGANGYILTDVFGKQYDIGAGTTLLPYLTRNIVGIPDLKPGTHILLWTDGKANASGRSAAEKIVIFQDDVPEDTAVRNGWEQVGTEWYYYEQGELKKGWLLDNGDWYYLDPVTGLMQTGFITVDGKTYYLEESGRMITKPRTFTPDESGALH